MNEMFRNLPDLKQIACCTPECLLKEKGKKSGRFEKEESKDNLIYLKKYKSNILMLIFTILLFSRNIIIIFVINNFEE